MRWPKPISRSPRASALSTHGLMRSRVPMASSISSTGSGAPPCSGPVSAQYPRGDRREQVGLGRGHDARGERRCVHAVVAHGDEIGVEGRDLARVGLAAEQHRQRIGGMAERSDRARRDRCLWRAAPARRRSPESADDGRLMRQVRFRRAIRRWRPGSRRRSTGRAYCRSRSGSRAKARSRAAPKAARTSASLIGWPVPPLHSRAVTPSKPVLRSEVADALAGDDQFAALAIDMAQHGFGGGNAVEADRGLGKLHVHGRLSLCCPAKGRPSRQIDQS